MKTFDTATAPHLPARRSVREVMGLVLAALVPGVLAHAWFFGPGIVIQIALATAFALGYEAAMLRLRGQPMRRFLTDLSAPLTAVLFAHGTGGGKTVAQEGGQGILEGCRQHDRGHEKENSAQG